jgi:hypothetical protein
MARLRQIASLGCCAFVVACGDPSPSTTTKAGTPVAFMRFSPESVSPNYSGVEDTTREVLRTRAEWEALWAKMEPRTSRIHGQTEPNPPPEIDFDHQIVVVAAMGTKPTGCCSIEISSVTETAESILVAVLETTAGHNCFVTQTVTHPIALALIPQTMKRIEFEVREETKRC